MHVSGTGQYRGRRRGSALTMMIVVSMVITSMVMVIAWTAGTNAQGVTALRNVDQAFLAAEAGAQRVAWYCKNSKLSTITSPLTGTINGYSYSTSWTTVSGTTIRITSVGSLGNVSYTLYQNVAPPSSGFGAINVGGNFSDKNVQITGDFRVNGNISANAGNGSVTGNVVHGGTFSGYSYTGTNTTGTFALLDFTTVGNTLTAAAGATHTGDQANKAFNFGVLSGTNKVIVVEGNVTNPTFNGSGTLFVKGNVKFTGNNVTYGSSGSPVNIVATGDVEYTKKISKVYGVIYAAGDLTTNQVDIVGGVYAGGDYNGGNSGQSAIVFTSAPWFLPANAGGTGSGTMVISNFAGPNP